MNERFENLMYHAGLTASGCWDKMDDYDHDAIKKFAELIIRECIKQARKDENGPAYEAVARIARHFGVE
jgi:hypothetical protein